MVMTVDQRGLIVNAPWRVSADRVAAFLVEHRDWVLRKLEVWGRHPSRSAAWANGETLRFVGRELLLEVTPGPIAGARLAEGACLHVETPGPPGGDAVKDLVVKWYRRHAQANFTERIALLAPRLGVATPRLFLSSAHTRWGSCSVRGDIRLNWRLIQATQATIDYVVVHELAHLIEMNHSRRFWKLVEAACPDYRAACAELNHMGPYYMDI